MTGDDRQSPRGTAGARLATSGFGWVVGLAALVTVFWVVIHRAEGWRFATLAAGIRPAWLMVAMLLQASTYLAQGAVWRHVLRRAGAPRSLGQSVRLSVAKLFETR